MPGPVAPPPASPAPFPEGSELVLPEGGTDDLAFLEGCRKSDAGLVVSTTGKPILLYQCFDASGNADVRVEVLDGSGAVATVCTSAGKAALEGGSLVIRDGGAKCHGDEADYSPSVVTCTQRGCRAAHCEIRYLKGDSSDSRFTFQGRC
jgi:hypothetical protein